MFCTARRWRRTDERGLTVVELSVALLLMGIVAIMAYSALSPTFQAVGRVDDESRGLADMRTAVERLSSDLRASRGVTLYPDSDQTKLVIWIDRDSNYQRSDEEIFTWSVARRSTSSQYDIVRRNRTGAGAAVASSLVSDIAFSYFPGTCDPAPCTDPTLGPGFGHRPTTLTTIVKVRMSYDAIPGLYSSAKLVGFDVRLRNTEGTAT